MFGLKWTCAADPDLHWVTLTTSKKMQKKLLVVTKRFKIAVNDFDAMKSVHCSWVLVVTELFEGGTKCKSY